MVYKNITNTTEFASKAGIFEGEDKIIVEMESGAYTFVKSADPLKWSGASPLSYTITLTKTTEAADLTDITVTDILPADVTFLPATVKIDNETSDNFDDSQLPTVKFGADSDLSVTEAKPLVITFQVSKNP